MSPRCRELGMTQLLFGLFFPRIQSRTHQTVNMCCTRRPKPVLVADVLDTLVADPFFNGMSDYFGFSSFQDFVAAKTPDVWVQFELGKVDEEYVAGNFFKDRRLVDVTSLKKFLKNSYRLLPGVDDMLLSLRDAGINVHLCSNYPVWTHLIEESLKLTSRFAVKWTFVSGNEGVRKPDKIAFQRVARSAGVDVSSCILLDDRPINCSGALSAGFRDAILFKNATQASKELQRVYAENGISLDLAKG